MAVEAEQAEQYPWQEREPPLAAHQSIWRLPWGLRAVL